MINRKYIIQNNIRVSILLVSFLLMNTLQVFAQQGIVPILIPQGGVHIDGDLISNTPTNNVGDWIKRGTGTGGGILDENGNPLNPSQTVHFVDAWDSQSDEVFQGSAANDPISQWKWTSKKAGGKNDINNVMIHNGNSEEGEQWLVFSVDRYVTNGSAYFDIEFLQNSITATTGGRFSSDGPDNGRTENDIMISFEFSNTAATIYFNLWENSGGTFQYVQKTLPVNIYYAAVNTANVDVPYGAFGGTTYTPGQFAEGAINITQLYDFLFGEDNCLSTEILTILVKSKASDSPTASLDDMLSPRPVNFVFGTSDITYDYSESLCKGGILYPEHNGFSSGIYSASPEGLSIDENTGAIDLDKSLPGDYEVIYTFRNGKCPVHTTVKVGNKDILAINDVNQTPVNKEIGGNLEINDHVDEGATLTVVSGTHLDVEGNDVEFQIGVPTNIYDKNNVLAGTITVSADGSYTFMPTTDYAGKVGISYKVTDGNCLFEAQLEIVVIPEYNLSQNNPPIAINDAYVTLENATLTSNILSNDFDPDGDDLTVVSATQGSISLSLGVPTQVDGVDLIGNPIPSAGTVTIAADGTITFTPSSSFIGSIAPINYVIEDEKGESDNAFVFINVKPKTGVNTTFAYDDVNIAPKGKTMTGNVLTNDFDPEGNTQTLTSVTIDGAAYPINQGTEITISGKGKLTMNPDGSYTFVPEKDFVGTVVVEQSVCDNGTPIACDNATLYLTNVDIAKGPSLLITNPMIRQRVK